MSVAQEQTVLSKIRERGHWRVVIRPTTFLKDRVEFAELFRIVERNAVRLRGQDFPHIDREKGLSRGADWVGQEIELEDKLEVWRLYRSGQFAHYFPLAWEWWDRSKLLPPDAGWRPGQRIYYINCIYSFLEIYEFAARLASSPAGDTAMFVEIGLANLKGRRLIPESIRYQLSGNYRIDVQEWSCPWEGRQTELIAKPRELAALATKEFFARFGLNLSIEIIKTFQETIGL
jgi:hypothetical protein